jgi:DNA mismatch repair protein PMS2
VRDVLASRSCRTSIMIGSPLNKQQQARIVARLADLQAPFNCPHGRPTMRHLAVLPEA